jgi:hypothetical protein
MVRQSSIGVFEADSVRWVTPYERTSHEAPLPASILYQSSGRVQDANLQDLLRGWYMCANRRQSGIVPGLEGKDTCAWGSLIKTDFLAMRFVWSSKWIERNILKWIERNISSRLRKLFHKTKKPLDPGIQTGIRYSRIVGVMDTIACLVASTLLLVSVLALTWIKSLGISLALVGILGTLFALALKLIGGDISRGEMFAATAAFYAVEVVFIGAITAMPAAACVCR